MNVWFLLLSTALLIGVLVFTAWLTDPTRVERRLMKRITRASEAFNMAIGTALIPAFQQATLTIGGLGVALAEARALDPEGWDRLERETS